MTSKERVLRAIAFKPCNDVPLWRPHFFEGFIKNWNILHPGFIGGPEEYYGYDTAVCLGDERFFLSEASLIEDDGEYMTELDGWGRLVKTAHSGYFTKTLQYPVEKKGNLDNLIFESSKFASRWIDFNTDVALEKNRGKCVFAKIGGIYVRSHLLRDESKLLEDMLIDESFCHELFGRVSAYFTEIALETLERGNLWETGLFIYDDMASTYSPMFSPKCFEKYLLPRYEKMIKTLKEKGCRHVFFHSDGNIGPLIGMLLDAGFEGFNPLEPRSGLDLISLRGKYGRKFVFFGGICNTVILPEGDKETIRHHVEPLIELAKEGGVVLGTASVAEDVPPDAYDYYMSLLGRDRKD